MAVGGQDIIQAGDAPSTPASGYGSIYIDSSDKMAKKKNDAGVIACLDSGYLVNGSLGSPVTVTAAGGVTFTAGYNRLLIFTRSASGAVLVTKDPAIQAGTIIGQELILWGTSDTNYLGIQSDTGVKVNGIRSIVLNACITFIWTGSFWVTKSENYLVG